MGRFGFQGFSLTICLCGITKAMLAGISHRVSGSLVLAQPEKENTAKARKLLACNISFSGSTGSFEGERCGEGKQATPAAPLPEKGYSCPLLVRLIF